MQDGEKAIGDLEVSRQQLYDFLPRRELSAKVAWASALGYHHLPARQGRCQHFESVWPAGCNWQPVPRHAAFTGREDGV